MAILVRKVVIEGMACQQLHAAGATYLSALQTMEMPIDGNKYDWLLNLQTLVILDLNKNKQTNKLLHMLFKIAVS